MLERKKKAEENLEFRSYGFSDNTRNHITQGLKTFGVVGLKSLGVVGFFTFGIRKTFV